MNRNLLVDSDILIDYMRQPKGGRTFFDQLKFDDLAVSHMSYAEILVGELYNHDLQTAKSRVGRLLSGYKINPIDEAVLDQQAVLSWTLRRQGNKLAIGDLIIAATALVYDRSLVTRNVRHFQRVPNLQIFDPSIS